ncbi:MAG: hypothetical protein M3Y32_02720 [Pseudomonadota bacterium]|nr:hypothetical protein [Pseudomonadota bacterium]
MLVLTLSIGSGLTALAQLPSYPDVLGAEVRASGADRFDFDVRIASPYDSPTRYGDGLRVQGAGGVVYGVRKLVHDHADEQPFTRDLYGVKIPAGVTSVTVQGRDQHSGWGGKTVDVKLPGR